MSSAGFVYVEDTAAADVLLINTCAFIEQAVEESIDTILDCREENRKAFLVVAGCLPLRYRKNLKKALPEVNLFLTPDQIENLPRLLHRLLSRAKSASKATHKQRIPKSDREAGACFFHKNSHHIGIRLSQDSGGVLQELPLLHDTFYPRPSAQL